MTASLITRVRLKMKRVISELAETPQERDFRRIWPLIDSIEGWLLPAEGNWLFNTARSLPDGALILEVGSFKGRSTCCLALGCVGTGRQVFAVDSFDGGPDLPTANSLPAFSENIERCELSDFVRPIVGLSTDVAKNWKSPIHLLFIDGSHQFEDVLADFDAFFPHVPPGGIVAFHDVRNESWPGVGRAWNETIKHQLKEIGYRETLAYGRRPGA
jgi:predicted O-methyltransferase YrrM